MSEVKRFRVCHPDHFQHDLVLASDFDAVVKERDDLKAKIDLPCGSCHPCTNWSAEVERRRAEKAEAELDALKATVERVKALREDYFMEVEHNRYRSWAQVVREFDAALAPQGEGKCALCETQAMHRWGTGCVDRRGTTGFDGQGRRYIDKDGTSGQWYSSWDRRKRTRRGGRG